MMLRSLKELGQDDASVAEGDVGRVDDFLFDEAGWMIRYFVIKTVNCSSSHRVLIPPRAILEIDWATRHFELAVSKTKIENRPDADVQNPASQQPDEVLHEHLGSPRYWHGVGTHPTLVSTDPSFEVGRANVSHLRSTKEVRGYDIQANDGSIGHVDDFILEDDNWRIRYLVIDTSNWWSDKKVLIAPEWATRISWEHGNVYVEMSRQAVQASPIWDPAVTVHREYESRLCEHYRRPGYWGVPP